MTNRCIVCHQKGGKKNTYCACNYTIHDACFYTYMDSNRSSHYRCLTNSHIYDENIVDKINKNLAKSNICTNSCFDIFLNIFLTAVPICMCFIMDTDFAFIISSITFIFFQFQFLIIQIGIKMSTRYNVSFFPIRIHDNLMLGPFNELYGILRKPNNLFTIELVIFILFYIGNICFGMYLMIIDNPSAELKLINTYINLGIAGTYITIFFTIKAYCGCKTKPTIVSSLV